MKTKIKGDSAESIACKFLEKRGFKLIFKNLRLGKLGEIDLIMKKGNLFNFVEVKSIDSEDFYPEIHFNKRKRKKLATLTKFLANKMDLENFMISLVAIDFKNKKIRYYENIEE